MAWTAPMTAVAGAVYTAAQFNTFVRDNLNETAPAKASTAGSYFVTSATNQISERICQHAWDGTNATTTSSSYTDPDAGYGPEVTAFTGSTALVAVGGRIGGNAGPTASVKMSWQVSGATSINATDQWAAGVVGMGAATGFGYVSRAFLATGLTPGLNTFTAKYAVSSGNGAYSARNILVMPF